MVRKANRNDVGRIIELLHQVNMVHHVIRPDLFKPYTTKYSESELEALLGDESKPVFVFDDGEVRGHAFCQVTEVKGHQLLEDAKTLYIDDICVDAEARGRHVGRTLYDHVIGYARENGFYNVTLNVWSCNEPALRFYEAMGLEPQRICMEKIL